MRRGGANCLSIAASVRASSVISAASRFARACAGLAAFDFPRGTLLLTEAGTKHRASLHVLRGERALAAHDPGGLDVLGATLEQFHAALTRESHTLKRALTDPRLLDLRTDRL